MIPCFGIALGLLVAGAAPAPLPPVECPAPEAGAPAIKVRVSAVADAIAATRKLMAKKGLHVTDLPKSAEDARRRLERLLDPSTVCAMRDDIAVVAAAARGIKIDNDFVAKKTTRIAELISRAGDEALTVAEVKRFFATANAALVKKRLTPANAALNQALFALYGSRDLWQLPPAPPPRADASGDDGEAAASSEAAPPPLTDDEVAAGCPMLARRKTATLEDLSGVRARVANGMDSRKIRLLDIKDGVALTEEMKELVAMKAIWPATRVACALLNRVSSTKVDIGFVSHRFQEVRARRLARPASQGPKGPEGAEDLVRRASDALAKSDFAAAHETLETLLVLLGEPAQPSAGLP